eukprot:4442010-Amphidinium_carterae.1
MLEWIVESALEEASNHPHPKNMVSLLKADEKDKYGRLTKEGRGTLEKELKLHPDMVISTTQGQSALCAIATT